MFLMDAASGSIARSKRRQERGSPCLTPLVIVYGLLIIPLIITFVLAFLYSASTVLTKMFGSLNAFSVSIRYLWSILS